MEWGDPEENGIIRTLRVPFVGWIVGAGIRGNDIVVPPIDGTQGIPSSVERLKADTASKSLCYPYGFLNGFQRFLFRGVVWSVDL